MATMTMTLIGLYNYDNGLFDNLSVPAGIDKDLFINSLLLKSGEFELLYPDLNFMKSMIAVWSAKWAPTFDKWLEGYKTIWNPVENYDRYEESTDEHSNTNKSTGKDTVKSDGTNEGLVSAYDSSNYQPSSKAVTGLDSESNTSSTLNEDGTLNHVSHIHGNIGVTQASDMLRGWYDISEWNLYDHMSDVFIREFCIPVY